MRSAAYYVAILILHIVNVLLFYKYVRTFLSIWPSWVAAALSATWFCTIEAAVKINAVFDLLAFTFSLVSILLFRSAINNQDKKKYIFAILAFIFAVRTKEYAVGLVPILFLQEIIFFKGGLKNTFKRISAYIVVFALLGFRYFQLYLDKSSNNVVGEGTGYHLVFDFRSLLENVYWYWCQAFYKPFISPSYFWVVFLIFAIVYIIGDLKLRRVYIFSVFSFIVLLGPVLLFSQQRSTLYLYAPHFFIAFILAATLESKITNKVLGIILMICVSVVPFITDWKLHSTNWHLARRGEVHQQLISGLPLISNRLAANNGDIVIFVSGVVPDVSAFINPYAVKSYLHQPINNFASNVYVLGLRSTKNKNEFIKKFCGNLTGKIYLEYLNNMAKDHTQDLEKSC
jgi:hypothetical protein